MGKVIELTHEQIRIAFAWQLHQRDVLKELYRLVFTDLDSIIEITGWPECGEKLWFYICVKFIEFDKRLHSDVVAGGLWMNQGWKVNYSMSDWEVSIEKVIITYKEV